MKATEAPPARWRIVHPDHLLWVRFGCGAAVFHRPSGKTHFLNSTSVVLLDRLSSEPIDGNEAAICVAQGAGGDLSPEFVDEIAATLHHFERVGLIQRSDA